MGGAGAAQPSLALGPLFLQQGVYSWFLSRVHCLSCVCVGRGREEPCVKQGDLSLQPSWPGYLINADPRTEPGRCLADPQASIGATDPHGKAKPCSGLSLFQPHL